MNSFSYHALLLDDSLAATLSYPSTQFYFTKLVTPEDCIIYPMEFGEYSQFSFPDSEVNILSEFNPNTLLHHKRIGDNDLPTKIAHLYQLQKLQGHTYIGRSLSAFVCVICTFSLFSFSFFHS